jgi:hypothetical protein
VPEYAATRPRLNAYDCKACGGSIVTVDQDEGVTPMTLACRATEGCRGTSYSRFYRADPTLTPTWEWYTPGKRELRRMSPEMRDHIKRGGLALRKIEEASDASGM